MGGSLARCDQPLQRRGLEVAGRGHQTGHQTQLVIVYKLVAKVTKTLANHKHDINDTPADSSILILEYRTT